MRKRSTIFLFPLKLFKFPSKLKRRRQENIRRGDFPRKVHTVACINLDLLKTSGIQGVILDLDNTIVSENDRYLSPEGEAWIKKAKLAGFKFFILSNGKRRYRVKAWSKRLDIPAINPARKPFPFAFRKALAQMQLTPKQVVVIGDSRHTDILGAWIVGCSSIQVATLPHPFRWWERLFGKYVQTPYPAGYALWDFDPLNDYEQG